VLRLYEPVREVRRSIVIDAPAHLVFAAVTDPAQIERWFASIDDVTFEARVGGRVSFIDPAFGRAEGRVTAIEPNRRLVVEFSANWPARLEFTMLAEARKTRLEVRQEGFDQVRDRDVGIPTMIRGLEAALEALNRLVVKPARAGGAR
jgi:uncharacterized protein YndB with AHSA1/START domain